MKNRSIDPNQLLTSNMGSAFDLTFPYINITGVHVNIVTVEDVHKFIERKINLGSKSMILHTNILAQNLAIKLPWFKDLLNSADLVFCDGSGVILGARILGYTIPERITYADWIWQLAKFLEQRGFSIYLLGAERGIAKKAAKRLLTFAPRLNIVGTHHGYFDKRPGTSENTYVIDSINHANPNILLVSLGMPLQERWLMDNWEDINTNIALTGGAALDYISGELQRSPRWLIDIGFEWLGRLIIEPRRLWKRYLIGNPVFIWRIYLQKFGLLRD